MNSYRYVGKDKNAKTVSGVINADSESEVTEILHKRELIVISVSAAKNSQRISLSFQTGQRIKIDDLVIFSRQLATMIDAGIPLVHSLGILAEQIEKTSLREVVSAMRADIQAGKSFSDSLSKHPKVFSELFINMAKAGETSGQLNEVLDRLASYLEKSAALARKIRTSLVYPTVVVIMAIIITAVLLLKVVPTFKNIFEVLGGDLPMPTQVLIGISDLLSKYFLFITGLLIISAFILKKYIATSRGRYNYDHLKLKVPVLGPLFRKLAVAKFSRTFSTLIKSGITVLNSLDIVSKTAGNKVVEEAVLNCSKSVRDGEPISRPLSKSGIFPPMVCRMINVGEQTGQLEKMLTKIADFYDEQIDAATAALSSMIEPLVIAFLGVIIGGIVISLFLPIFKITQLIAR